MQCDDSQKAQEVIQTLITALEWYADPMVWIDLRTYEEYMEDDEPDTATSYDRGKRARDALAQVRSLL